MSRVLFEKQFRFTRDFTYFSSFRYVIQQHFQTTIYVIPIIANYVTQVFYGRQGTINFIKINAEVKSSSTVLVNFTYPLNNE